MPYVRKSGRSSYRSSRSVTRTVRGKPKATKNRNAIYKLSRKVNKLQSQNNRRTLGLMFKKADDFNLASNYIHRQLVVPTSITGSTAWTQVFGNNTNAEESRSLTIKSLHMEYKLAAGDEESLINHTIMAITPKTRKVYKETFNETTGLLSLVSDQDYVMVNGMALINKARWKIHFYKRHHTVQQAANQANNVDYPIKANMGKIVLKNLNWRIRNTQGPWTDVSTNELPIYMRIFLICFNDNSGFDLEYPTFSYSSLFKCTAQGAK